MFEWKFLCGTRHYNFIGIMYFCHSEQTQILQKWPSLLSYQVRIQYLCKGGGKPDFADIMQQVMEAANIWPQNRGSGGGGGWGPLS